MPMTLEGLIGKQPPTIDHEGLEWVITTEIGELRSEKEYIQDFAGPDEDSAWCAADVCDAKITFLEAELDRIQREIRTREDELILRNERELEDRHRI